MGAYTEWKRVLKPVGRLLVFDGNWYMNFFDEETDRQFKSDMAEYQERFGEFPASFSMYRMEDYWLKLPLVGIRRPDWDRATLWKLGFENISCRTSLDELWAAKQDRDILYRSAPLFMVSADRA